MSQIIKKGNLSSTWPMLLGYNKAEISTRLEALTKEGKSSTEAFSIVLFENNTRAANQLRQYMEENLNFINDKIESLT